MGEYGFCIFMRKCQQEREGVSCEGSLNFWICEILVSSLSAPISANHILGVFVYRGAWGSDTIGTAGAVYGGEGPPDARKPAFLGRISRPSWLRIIRYCV